MRYQSSPRWRRALYMLSAAVVSIAATAWFVPGIAAAAPGLDRDDSFYALPNDLSSMQPGQIVRTRSAQVKSFQLFPLQVDAWQIAYRTTDFNNTPDMSVTTLMFPRGVRPTKLLSYQAATDSTLQTCAPSYTLTQGLPVDLTNPRGPVTFGVPAAEAAMMSLGLQEGWAVAAPDHGGHNARWLTPRQPGYAVLDGIRAVKNFERTLMPATSPVALWGYSGGAIATSWAIEVQPAYAPELTSAIKGAALGAPVRNLESSLRSASGTLGGGLIPGALGAAIKDAPELEGVFRKYMTAEGMARIDATRDHCLVQNVLANMWFDYHRYLKTPLTTMLSDPKVAEAFRTRGISGLIPTAPTYVYNAVSEEVAPITGTDKLVQSYCDSGSRITYRREVLPPNPVPQISTPHGIEMIAGMSGAFNWIRDRLDDRGSVPRGCDIQTVMSTGLQPQNLQSFGPQISTMLQAIGGAPIGSP